MSQRKEYDFRLRWRNLPGTREKALLCLSLERKKLIISVELRVRKTRRQGRLHTATTSIFSPCWQMFGEHGLEEREVGTIERY